MSTKNRIQFKNYPSISEYKLAYVRRRILSWSQSNFSIYPWRENTSKFHGLIAEILLQRTQADQVVTVYQNFVRLFPDAATLSAASLADVEAIVATLGLKKRAKYIHELGIFLASKDGFINDPEILLRIRGIGQYTASAYLSLHCGVRKPIYDSNVSRFYSRFFGFPYERELRGNRFLADLSERLTPRNNFQQFNYALIDFTRLVCKSKANHKTCPLSRKCYWGKLVNFEQGL
jgi:A/G-specific adenine glycosylase